jgi:mRNA-degrading endonuclease toxin of MazEF toxin-antitoxin module
VFFVDQIRTVDRARLVRRLGTLPGPTSRQVCAVLVEMFAWN